MVHSHRGALRARLLSLRYLLRIGFSSQRLGWYRQSHGRGDPGQPCHASGYEGEPEWFTLIAGRFARGCSLSDIYYGLVSPRNAWGGIDKVMAGGTPANPATLVVMRVNPNGSLSSRGASRAAALSPIFITDWFLLATLGVV